MWVNLPVGINLDPTSVRIVSPAGNYGPGVFFTPRITAQQNTVINGVNCISYRIEVNNKYDIIVRGGHNNNYIPSAPGIYSNYANQTQGAIRFKAIIGTGVSSNPSLDISNFLYSDPGRTSPMGVADVNNLAGKGAAYILHKSFATTVNIIQKPGLVLDMGIRPNNSTGGFFTYNGTDVSIAKLSRDTYAELSVRYQNTSTDMYYPGTSIFIPIPKKGLMYDHYFNNTELQATTGTEAAQTANRTPQWSAVLLEEAVLPDFDTFYGVDRTTVTNYSTPMSNTWEPITMTWYTYADLLAAGYTLADVTFLKFAAYLPIDGAGHAGDTGQAIFHLALSPDAQVGEIDYWRAYEKGWRTATGDGSWMYGGVVAATPAMSGVQGKFFFDVNRDGIMEPCEEYSAGNPMPAGFTATLTGTGIVVPIQMAIDAAGNFKSVDANGNPVYLESGNYTVTITNPDPYALHFDDVTLSSPRSYFDNTNTPVWFNDISLGLVRSDNTVAVFNFTPTALSAATQLVGIGLKTPQNYIPVNPHIRVNLLGSEPCPCVAPVTPGALRNDIPPSVTIAGSTWSTKNVGAPGTFVANAWDPGMFYQWDSKIGWSSSDPIVNSNGGTTWSTTYSSNTVWDMTNNNPCPTGWRVPTDVEIQALNNIHGVWINASQSQNLGLGGMPGRIFGTATVPASYCDFNPQTMLFLPAAGIRNNTTGALNFVGALGNYWGSVHGAQESATDAFALYFNNMNIYGDVSESKTYGYPVRCVKK